MAYRPIFYSLPKFPFYETINVSFDFEPGFSLVQKQKNIINLHSAYLSLCENRNILDISTKSTNHIGVLLSAFNLNVNVKNEMLILECVFQGSKVFENGGPYRDLVLNSPYKAKKDKRLKESGKLIYFDFFNEIFPNEPKDYFYNWLYINGLYKNKTLSEAIMQFDSFSDIEFNPSKSINSQAKAAAIFVGLKKSNQLESALESKDSFLKIVYGYENSDFYQMSLF